MSDKTRIFIVDASALVMAGFFVGLGLIGSVATLLAAAKVISWLKAVLS